MTAILDELELYCADKAREFREAGLALDRAPDDVAGLADLDGVRFFQQTSLPPRHQSGEFPSALRAAASTVAGAIVAAERLAYGDPGVVLASPGPALSGLLVSTLADEAVADRYFDRLNAAPAYTFFALTETEKGSAVMELSTTLRSAPDGDGWLLDGEKCYIGNGARAALGVVFARRAPGPWGIEAVLVDAAADGFHAEPLETVGLRGARLGRLRFEGVRVPPENLLGAHLPASRRGLNGATKMLARTRPAVSAFALGCAQAAADYLTEHRPRLPRAPRLRADDLRDRIAVARAALRGVAGDIDRGTVDPHRISAVKVQSSRLAQAATLLAAELLGAASLVEHPWLEKAYRDARAFDIMEGAANLHLLAVFQGVQKGKSLAARADSG
jgi:alkylation response protein AidB-like acyl-CoA dehydrogenase